MFLRVSWSRLIEGLVACWEDASGIIFFPSVGKKLKDGRLSRKKYTLFIIFNRFFYDNLYFCLKFIIKIILNDYISEK